MGPGYVADAVALCSFQLRYDLRYSDPALAESVDGIGIVPEHICVFEAKISRGDFLAQFRRDEFADTLRNGGLPSGTLHWVVARQDDVRVEELPSGWGLLVVSGCGSREVLRPRHFPVSRARIQEVAYQLLWRDQ